MNRAILYGSGMALGVIVGVLVVKSAAWFHPLPLALAYIVVALRSAIAGG